MDPDLALVSEAPEPVAEPDAAVAVYLSPVVL